MECCKGTLEKKMYIVLKTKQFEMKCLENKTREMEMKERNNYVHNFIVTHFLLLCIFDNSFSSI